MSQGTENTSTSMERLSALVDGELDEHGTARACAGWRDEASVRSSWHAYQLIGDVLRSEDLASDASRDRLAGEPVVLAPKPLPTPQLLSPTASVRPAGGVRAKRWSWMGPSAVAAGFMAVAGVLVVTRAPGPAPTPSPSLAQAAAPGAATQVATVPVSAGSDTSLDAQSLVVSWTQIRDARLDRYLAAHKQFAGSSALGVPSAFLRSATSDASNR